MNKSITPLQEAEAQQTVQSYFEDWIEKHGKANLRPSSIASYRGIIRNYIVPYLGQVPLQQLSAPMIDEALGRLTDRGLSPGVVRLVRKTMSAALEQARKYHYIESNPTKDLITKLAKDNKTPEPYTISQMQQLLSRTLGTRWEMPVMLAGLYGLRISEVLGLRWDNVDLERGVFSVCEQLPYKVPAGTTVISSMAPVKSLDRELPITDMARPYFLRQKQLQQRRMEMARMGGGVYYDNRLVVASENGAPYRRERMSNDFGRLLRALEMPHIRFHDLRHTAATNMHELTGDFYTVGNILGHSLGGTGLQLQLPAGLDATTARYVSVRMDRKRTVLEAYHREFLPPCRRAKVLRKTDLCHVKKPISIGTFLKESSRTGAGCGYADGLCNRFQRKVL